jgi:hypothetical protein
MVNQEIKFYIETSALEYFLSTMNMRGIDAQATHELQLSKNREWYISTTTLWELMQISDYKDYDHALYLASLLVNRKLLKSPSEIILDYLDSNNEDNIKKTDIFSTSMIAKCWERTCDDRSYTFNIINSPLIDMTKELKNISRMIPYIIGIHDNNNDENNKSIKTIVEFLYNVQFKDEVSKQIQYLRKISILLCFLLICCGCDIAYDIVKQYWKNKNITDFLKRYDYILERKPEIINTGPLWLIANVILSQCDKQGINNRGTMHDGFHIVNIPFIDIFLTNDNHFTKIRDKANKESYELFYRKIYHMNELRVIQSPWQVLNKEEKK